MPDNNQPAEPQELDYQRDIASKSTRDIVAEVNEWEQGEFDRIEKKAETPTPPAEAQPTTPEETPAQVEVAPEKPPPPSTPPPPAVVETKPAETKPPLDEDALTEKITTKLLDQLAPKTEEQKKDFNQKLKDMVETAQKEGREPTYTEALALMGDELTDKLSGQLRDQIKKEVLSDLDKEVETEQQRIKTQADQETQQREETQKSLHTEWDRQVGILQTENSFPKIVNVKDDNDPGNKQQRILFQALNNRIENQKKTGQKVSLSLIEAYHSPEYKALVEQAGKDAPVSGSHKSVGPSTTDGYTYQELHNMDIRDIVAESHQDSQ